MQYSSLDDAIHAIAAHIGLPEFLGDETRIYERAGVVVEFEQDYIYACRYSFAAAVLHQCITNSAFPPHWWSMHPDTGMAVIGDSVAEEGLAILVRFARLIRREQERDSNHRIFACADGPFLGENGLPSRKPRTIDTTELFSEMGGLYWFQSVGLVTSELVKILDGNGINHNLSSQALPLVTVIPESVPTKNTATLAPVVEKMVLASDLDEVNDVWWKIENDIFDIAQNIGSSLRAKNKPYSNTAIGAEVAGRIKAMEFKKGGNRKSPSTSTVRKMLNGWRIQAD